MVAKQEERNALDKITEIIKSVGGNDSYIGAAFKGCIDDAIENIEYDCMLSYYDRFEEANTRAYNLSQELKCCENDKKSISELNDTLRTLCNTREETIMESQKTISKLVDELKQTKDELNRANEIIINLKAKLYDLICQ